MFNTIVGALILLVGICFGIWIDRDCPVPGKRGHTAHGNTEPAAPDAELKKVEEKLKEQWENLFSYDGSNKE